MKKITMNEKGFTLVEMAIVLVIIGLLLGGVLKGQELIDNAKTKKAINELNSVSVAFNAYQDRFNRIPGDDGPLITLTNRGGAWANVNAAGNLNGILTIVPAQTFTGAGEGVPFWQALRAAGYITGDPATVGVAAIPTNAFLGLMGVANNTTNITGMDVSISVCMSQVPGKMAIQIDTQLDDSNPASGTVRATQSAAGANTVPGAAAAAYDETQIYTICKSL